MTFIERLKRSISKKPIASTRLKFVVFAVCGQTLRLAGKNDIYFQYNINKQATINF
jgi:hypothetical protein